MPKIVFLIHGKYTHRHRTEEQVRTVFSGKYDLSCIITQTANQFTSLAFEAVKNGATHIICVGGDGSLNETVNGLMKAKADAGSGAVNWPNIRIGLLPAGTGNDFSRTTQVLCDVNFLKELIEKDRYKPIDMGLAELTSPAGEKISRYFINIMDIGIGGYISKRIAGSSKPFGPFITYQLAILSALLRYKNQQITIGADTFKHQGLIMSFIMANGKYFGGGLGISPDAVPNDGQFSTVLIGNISMLDYLRNLGRVRKCLKLDHPELRYSEARKLRIDSPAPLAVDMDGEFVGYTPLKLDIVPGAVNFLCPL